MARNRLTRVKSVVTILGNFPIWQGSKSFDLARSRQIHNLPAHIYCTTVYSIKRWSREQLTTLNPSTCKAVGRPMVLDLVRLGAQLPPKALTNTPKWSQANLRSVSFSHSFSGAVGEIPRSALEPYSAAGSRDHPTESWPSPSSSACLHVVAYQAPCRPSNCSAMRCA